MTALSAYLLKRGHETRKTLHSCGKKKGRGGVMQLLSIAKEGRGKRSPLILPAKKKGGGRFYYSQQDRRVSEGEGGGRMLTRFRRRKGSYILPCPRSWKKKRSSLR